MIGKLDLQGIILQGYDVVAYFEQGTPVKGRYELAALDRAIAFSGGNLVLPRVSFFRVFPFKHSMARGGVRGG